MILYFDRNLIPSEMNQATSGKKKDIYSKVFYYEHWGKLSPSYTFDFVIVY
jgi:hypothetical protein